MRVIGMWIDCVMVMVVVMIMVVIMMVVVIMRDL